MRSLEITIKIFAIALIVAIIAYGVLDNSEKVSYAKDSLMMTHSELDESYPQGQDPKYFCDQLTVVNSFRKCTVTEWRRISYYVCPVKNVGKCVPTGHKRIKRPTNYGTFE